jgi:GTPase SAR1 family protein
MNKKSLPNSAKTTSIKSKEIKIVFCGESSSGKTSIIMRLIGAKF